MSRQWACPQGHRWDAGSDDTTLVDAQAVCPFCGSRGATPAEKKSLRVAAPIQAANDQTLDPGQPLPAPSDGTIDFTGPLEALQARGGKLEETLVPPPPQPASGFPAAGTPGKTSRIPSNVPPASGITSETIDVRAVPPSAQDGRDEPTLSPESHTAAFSPGGSAAADGNTLAPTVPTVTAHAAPAVRIPGYEVLGVLGRGGMGVVYKARQAGLNRLTALKMILAGGHASSTDLARFQIEAQAVAKLQHPGIVQIYEVGESNGHPYFSLEYLDGGTLQKKQDGKPVVVREAARITEALARAVHFAHERGIIHRDLKPANVLLAVDGTPKITDFGLAKRLDEDSKQTGTGAVMGTPSYMAPEQARGETHDVGPAADIYSLGAILYDLLTGRPPFAGATVLDTLQQVQNDEPVPPRRMQPRIPRDLDTICLKCLQKEPAKRYASAEALADDLQRFLDNVPIQARPISAMERVVKAARRRPAVAALLALLLVVLVSGFTGMFVLWQRAESQWARAEEARKEEHRAKQEAVENADRAERHAQEATENLRRANATLYDANMNLAQGAYENAKVSRLRELLGSQLPADAKAEDRRKFEWHYLQGLVTSDRLALKSHVQLARSVAFRPPTGRDLASASGDGTVVVWNPTATGPERYVVLKDGLGSAIQAIAFSRDGRWLAAASDDGSLRLWDMQTLDRPARVFKGHEQSVTSVTFDSSGNLLASGSADQTVRLWDVAQAKEIARLGGYRYAVTDVAFDEAGKRLASTDLERKVRVWDVAERKVILERQSAHWLSSVVFSPDGKNLAWGGWENFVRMWNVNDGDFILPGLTSPVKRMAFSPEGQRLACACQDDSVTVWDVPTRKVVRVFPAEKGLVRSVAFSPDGQLLASVNFETLTTEALRVDASDSLLALSFGSDVDKANRRQEQLAFGGADGSFYLWNLQEPRPRRIETAHGPLRTVAFCPTRKEWASGGDDGTVQLWRFDGERKTTIPAHERWVLALAYSPDGSTLASGSADRTIALWDPSTGQRRHLLKGHTGFVRSIAFSPDGKLLVSAGDDRSVRLWKADGSEAISFPTTHTGAVLRVAYSADGNYLASAGTDRDIRLWNPQGKLVHTLRGHTHGVTALRFTPDSSRLASASEDRTIKLWDLNTGQETLTLKGPTAGITDLAFDSTGTRLACTSWDRTVTVWGMK